LVTMPDMSKSNGHEPVVHKPLTAKQQRFVEEYLVDSNAAQAAIRAGYSPACAKQQGAENLSKPYLMAAVQIGQKKLAQRCEHSADNALRAVAGMAYDVDLHEGYRLKALDMLLRIEGMYVEKHAVHHSGSIADGTGGLQATMDLVEAINASRDTESLPQSLSN